MREREWNIRETQDDNKKLCESSSLEVKYSKFPCKESDFKQSN